MARICIPEGTEPESLRLLQLDSRLTGAMTSAASALYGKLNLPVRTREIIRMRVAYMNQCQLCLRTRFPDAEDLDTSFFAELEDWKNSDRFTPKERLVAKYTDMLVRDHLTIDDAFIDSLKKHFSDVEIFEITSAAMFFMANGRIMRVLDIESSCSI